MKSHFSSYSYALVFLAVLLFGCSNERSMEQAYKTEIALDSVVVSQVPAASSSEAVVPTSPERKFIRTADVKFKTGNVTKATETIEDLTRKYEGFVSHTDLTSRVVHSSSTQIKADTVLQQMEYVVENTMTLRVPNTQFDNLLKEISQVTAFLDHRVINADDVSLQLLENSLRIKRNQKAEQRVEQAIKGRGKKLNETIQAEESLLNKQQEADASTIENMNYMDQVNFSTIKLTLYQPRTVFQEKIYQHPVVQTYEAPLASRLYDAFLSGWKVFEQLLVFLVNIWALLVVGAVAFWLYRKYGFRIAKQIGER